MYADQHPGSSFLMKLGSSASLSQAERGTGRLHPEIEVGRLLFRFGGFFVPGLATGTAGPVRVADDLEINLAGMPAALVLLSGSGRLNSTDTLQEDRMVPRYFLRVDKA